MHEHKHEGTWLWHTNGVLLKVMDPVHVRRLLEAGARPVPADVAAPVQDQSADPATSETTGAPTDTGPLPTADDPLAGADRGGAGKRARSPGRSAAPAPKRPPQRRKES